MDIGRGLIEPIIFMEDPNEAYIYSQLARLCAHVRTTPIRGKSQRRGDFNQDCLELYRFAAAHELTEYQVAVSLGRKGWRKYRTFFNAYMTMYSTTNSIVRDAIQAMGENNEQFARYHLSNISDAMGQDEVVETLLFQVLAAPNGNEAEEIYKSKKRWQLLWMPIRHTKNFEKAIKLLGLEYNQTQIALLALDDIRWFDVYDRPDNK